MRSARAAFCIAYSLALRDHLLKLLDRGIAVHNFDELTVVHDLVLYEIFRNEVHLFSVLAEDPFGALILSVMIRLISLSMRAAVSSE